MVRRVASLFFVCLICLATSVPASTWSQGSSVSEGSGEVQTLPGSALGDSSRALVPPSDADAAKSPFRNNTERPLSMYLAKNTRLFGYEFYHASDLECAWSGAGTGMTLGMIAGALGMSAGMWDEESSWYIAGAMAALGALWGYKKADDPGWTIRVRWAPEDR